MTRRNRRTQTVVSVGCATVLGLINDRHEEGELIDPAERSRVRPGQVAVVAGAAVLVFAALMPWATVRSGFGQVSLSGTDGDGLLTLAIGAVVAVAAWLRMYRTPWRVAMVILCVLAALIVGYDIANVGSLPGGEFADVSVGAGLYLTFLAARGHRHGRADGAQQRQDQTRDSGARTSTGLLALALQAL